MAGDQRAGRGHADEDRLDPLADRGARLLAERGVRLVADHDRVGVRDVAGVADEPLVGLDRDRAPRRRRLVLAEQRRRDALPVAAVGQLADELVDEVAAVGEDQHAAGARRLDEAERGDGLAGAGRVLEPEAAGGVGVVGDSRRRAASSSASSRSSQSSGSSSSAISSSPSSSTSPEGSSSTGSSAPRRRRRPCRSRSPPSRPRRPAPRRVSAISVPDRASTWCADSDGAVDELRLVLGEQRARGRASASSSAATRATARRAPPSISASASSSARPPGVPAASTTAGVLALVDEGLERELLGALYVSPEPARNRQRKCSQPSVAFVLYEKDDGPFRLARSVAPSREAVRPSGAHRSGDCRRAVLSAPPWR